MNNEAAIENVIIQAGKRLHSAGLIASSDGNISVRKNNRIYITPSGVNKGFLKKNDIVSVPVEIVSIEDITPKPSIEFFMHKAVYEGRSDINAVIHVHSPFSTVFAARGILPDYSTLLETKLLPKADIVAEFEPGSIELADAVGKSAKEYDLILLKRHGLVAMGADMDIALNNIERFEFLCKIDLYLKFLR